MSASPASSALKRFSRHELRLAWRDWAWMFSGWRNTSLRRALIGMGVFYAIVHLIAYALLSPHLAAAIILPITLCMTLISLWGAVVTFAGAMIAAASAIQVQLWFRSQAQRTTFRRRQVALKASTFAEAGASIACAASTALVAAGSPLAVLPVVLLLIVLAISWSIRPKRSARTKGLARA